MVGEGPDGRGEARFSGPAPAGRDTRVTVWPDTAAPPRPSVRTTVRPVNKKDFVRLTE